MKGTERKREVSIENEILFHTSVEKFRMTDYHEICTGVRVVNE